MHVLIAPNAFKNSLSAAAAAAAIAAGLDASAYTGSWALRPVADGGDGTAELLIAHCGGRVVPVGAHDALGRPIAAHFGLIDEGRTAVIELAEASGLRRLSAGELDPLRATTAGTGDLVRAALDCGVREILLCVGGSATVDGAAGLLHEMGAVFRDADGAALADLPASLVRLSAIDCAALDPRMREVRMVVLCDVDNPLTGPAGAARVFGPQKGATPADVTLLDAALGRLARVLERNTGRCIAGLPGAGAAGGAAGGLHGLLGAHLVAGADYFLDRIAFDAALAGTHVLFTGEGSLDRQTAQGKAPWAVAMRAKRAGAFVIGLAGQVPLSGDELYPTFDAVLSICNGPGDLAQAIACTADNLKRTAAQVGNLLERLRLV